MSLEAISFSSLLNRLRTCQCVHRLAGLVLVLSALLSFTPALSMAAESAEEIATLEGLILHSSPESVLPEGDPGLEVTGLHIKGSGLLASDQLAEMIDPLLGNSIDDSLLKEIQTAILAHYRAEGFPLVDIVLPPQTITHGVLQVMVIESKFGKIVFEGTNKWTKTEHIQRNLHIAQGEPIHERTLMSDLTWLNGNSFRSLDLYYKPGEGRFESDLVVRTTERFPLGGFVGIDNTGNRLTGESRITTGFEWGKAFGLHDNSLTYRYITDTDFEFLRAHVASYVIRFPWHHSLTLTGSYSEIKGDLDSTPISQEGTSAQGNLRYNIELPRFGAFRQQFSIGADFRRLDNNLEFNSEVVLADTTEIAQGVLGYTGLLPDKWGSTFFGAEYYYSPGNISGRNKDDLFQASFPSSEANYQYAKLNLERMTRMPFGVSWRASGAYQFADGNLIPSEQIGLGGAFTIRGFEERIVSGTEGFLVSNELRFPSFSLGRRFDKTAKDEMQILGFLDYGETSNRILQPDEDPHLLLMSAGVGMRYQVSRFLSVRFDYGWQLTDPFKGVSLSRDVPDSRGHVSATFNF